MTMKYTMEKMEKAEELHLPEGHDPHEGEGDGGKGGLEEVVGRECDIRVEEARPHGPPDPLEQAREIRREPPEEGGGSRGFPMRP